MFKKIFSILSVLLFTSNVFCETAIKRILDNKKIIVGLEAGNPPFEFKKPSGDLIGFDIDIASELAKAMNVSVEFKEYKFVDLIPALDNDEIDIIISGMTKTLERALKVNFTEPYYKTGQTVVSTAKKKDVNLSELNKKEITIGIQKGTTGETAVKKFFPQSNIKLYDNMENCGKDLVENKIDAFVYDKPLAEIFVKRYPEKTYIISGELTTEYYCFAVKQGDFDFICWLNYFIDELIKSGEYNKIYKKWFIDKTWEK